MFESIIEVVRSAETLIEEGDQGDAQALLTQSLLSCRPAVNEAEAIAIAEATGLIIELDAGLLPGELLEAHLERMQELTSGFDGAAVTVARAEAELGRIEWVHSHRGGDPIVLVEVLQAASVFVERERGSQYEGVRRAAAEAALTAQILREWLNQDANSVAVAMESLALGLTGETDLRMRVIRISALAAAARLRIEYNLDQEDAEYLLRTAISEAAECPPARNLYYSLALQLADLALARGKAPAESLVEAFTALHSDNSADPNPEGVRLRCWHLEQVLDRVATEDRGAMAVTEWTRLIDSYASNAAPRVRATMLEQVRFRANEVSELNAVDFQILRYADAAVARDEHPETAKARFQVAAQIVEVLGYPGAGPLGTGTAPRRDAILAVQLSEDLEKRFPHAERDPELGTRMARQLLNRALRLSEIGRLEQALTVLAGFRAKFAKAPAEKFRSLFAQAEYWQGRLNREAGHRNQARSAVDSLVAEFSQDPDPDVRVWAANALFSAWRDNEVDPAEAAALLERFAEIFATDPELRIRRHDAVRRLTQGVNAHEQGATAAAVRLLQDLVDGFADDPDADISDTVRLAHQNLAVLLLSSANAGSPTDTTITAVDSAERYSSLRDRLYAADTLYESGRQQEAVHEWELLVEATAGTNDPHIAVLGLAALDMWGGYLSDTRRWMELIEVSRHAMITRGSLDFRAERMRARAYLRFGIAQGTVGDPLSAISAYETLDALVAESADDELITVRQQAVYNRAVLIDDLGDAEAAINAYDHVLAVHSSSFDSQSRRLRRVKALRNKAQLLSGFGRLAETAVVHRQVLDIALNSPDPAVNERARLSAFSLAECHTRLGEHSAAALAYEWVRLHPNIGFTKADFRSAAQAKKAAERESRRTKKARG